MNSYPTMSAQVESGGGTLVHGARPNNAELSITGNDAELGLVPPASCSRLAQPQTRERQALLGEHLLTGYLKTVGPIEDGASALGSSDHTKAARLRPSLHHIGNSVDTNLSFSRDNIEGAAGSRKTPSSTTRSRTVSPDDFRRSISSSTKQQLKRVPEEMEGSNTAPTSSERNQIGTVGQRYYGSVGHGTMPARNGADEGVSYLDGTLSYYEDSELSEDEEECLLDEELAKQGLYRGSYKNLILLYTLVPLSTGLAFILLALIPVFAFPNSSHSPFPYPPYLPFPLPEIFTATALWSLSFLLRDFLYATSLFTTSLIPFPYRFRSLIPILTSILFAVIQSVSTLFFRQLAVPILLIPYYSTERLGLLQPPISADSHPNNLLKHHFPTWQHDAFRRVWGIALGWAAAEAMIGIKQGYENIALYKDVLVNVSKNSSRAGLMAETNIGGIGRNDQPGNKTDSPRALTPIASQDMVEDTNTTRTQREWEPDQGTLSVNTTVRPVLQRGCNSDSLSSSSNSLPNSRYDPIDDLRASEILAETRPLLNLDPASLTRRQTRESERILAENEVERDLDQLMALKSREELVEIYGIPVIRIPSFISCLHRINSIFVSLGSCLFLTAAYMRSTFAYSYPPSVSFSPSSSATLFAHPFTPSNKTLIITAPILLAVQTLLTMMHTPWILPRIGIQTFVYVTLLVSLGLFFGGLGLWEALS